MSELEQAQELRGSPDEYKSYLYYGPGGSGKTTLFLNLPGEKILLDVDNKAHAMEHIPPEVRKHCKVWTLGPKAEFERLEVISKATKIKDNPPSFQRIVATINELLDLARKCKRSGEPFPYKWAGLDSWTEVSDLIFAKVKFDQGVSQMSWKDWGILHANNLAVVNGFLQLPCNRVIIAHDVHTTIRDPQTEQVLAESIRPAVAGQLKDTFAKYFDEVYYFKGRQRSGDYQIQTVKDNLLVARTSRNIPSEILIDKTTKQLILK